LLPEEAVKLEAMLRAYTLEGAFSLFKENEIGSLEAGKLADIIILDRNLFQIPPYEIHNASVVQTIFNGKIVYKEGKIDKF
jgi:predicted amidohydrolase YtcJ